MFRAVSLIAAGSLAGCTGESPETAATTAAHQPTVATAGYMTFDALEGGCQNGAGSPGLDCNTYAGPHAAFMSGGPTLATTGLADGTYFFAVLAPGSQNGEFLDGSAATLSSDDVSNRTFTVEDHEIVSYAGMHQVGANPGGRFAIGLAPFDDSDDPNGLYILAVCAEDATDPAQCTYDAFRLASSDSDEPAFPRVHGGAFNDADLDGHWDAGEPGIPGWKIDYHDVISGTVETGPDGTFTLELIPDGYLLVDRAASSPAWLPTGIDNTRAFGGASATLNADRTYWVEVADNQVVHGIYFGIGASSQQAYQAM